jgi:replicative DNA helicase
MIDSERALLGAVLSGYKGLSDLTRVVTGEDFAQVMHEEIWNAALRVHAAGNTPDPVQVRAALGERATRLPGGPTYLVDLMQACPLAISAPAYAKALSEEAGRRRLRSVGQAIIQLAEAERDVTEIVEEARQRLDEATRGARERSALRIGDTLPGVIETAEHGTSRGMSTPWPDLDRIANGLAPGRLIVIGARPGTGKSLAAVNIAARVAERYGKGVYLSSLEMGSTEVAQRMMSAHARVDLSRLERGGMSEGDWEATRSSYAAMQSWPLHIDDSSNQTVASIRANVRDLSRKHDMSVVIVDYLQLLTPRDRRAPREQQVAEMSQGLKQLAREQNVCVIAIASLNRGGAGRADKRPVLTDLRESGSIESDADLVILMHRPSDDKPDIEVIVAKQRNGPLGECRLQLQGHFARLVSAGHFQRSA